MIITQDALDNIEMVYHNRPCVWERTMKGKCSKEYKVYTGFYSNKRLVWAQQICNNHIEAYKLNFHKLTVIELTPKDIFYLNITKENS